jgi:2-methoxy-6-polyprenyl-1,4-benzoquinol methylase
MHRVWKDRLVEKLRPRPGQRHLDVAGGTGDVAFRVLDAMRQAQHSGSSSSFAGSGSTFAGSSSGSGGGGGGYAQPAAAAGAADLQQQAQQHQQQPGALPPPPSVTVCDINASMLAEGRRKAEGRGIGPESMQWVEGNAEALPFDSGVFDSYTVAFGIRNVTDRPAALREAYRCAQRR